MPVKVHLTGIATLVQPGKGTFAIRGLVPQNYFMNNIARASTFALMVFGISVFAQTESPIQMDQPIPSGPIQELPWGMTDKMAADWSSVTPRLYNQPDRSMQSVWVRIFPLSSVPRNDPFPVTKNRGRFYITNGEGILIYSLEDGTLLGSTKKPFNLNFKSATFSLNGKSLKLVPLWIVAAGQQPITVQWDKGTKVAVAMQLHGGFVVQKAEEDAKYTSPLSSIQVEQPLDFANSALDAKPWSVINVVNMNEYLQGVVPSEVVFTWHSEALRMQAIAARTYGLYEMADARLNKREWDVDPTTWYQCYRGVKFRRGQGAWDAVEQPSTTQAVQNTFGEVVIYKGEVIKAYFSGNSGGRSCTASECFHQVTNPPYLQEVVDADGVWGAEGGSWGGKANLTAQSIAATLKTIGIQPAHPVSHLESLVRGPSGRTWRLRVVLSDNSHIDLDEAQTKAVMDLFGGIRSYLYQLGAVDQKSGKQAILGHGYGHGVGMSQYGGQLFALSGWDAHRILLYFYANTQIRNLSGP